jgi:hypothetical protein
MLSRGTRCIEERQIQPRPRSPHLAEGALRAQRLASRSRDGARRPAFAGPLTADWSRSAWGVLLERADARRLIWPSVCHVAARDRGRLTSARGVVGRGGAGRAEALRVAAEFEMRRQRAQHVDAPKAPQPRDRRPYSSAIRDGPSSRAVPATAETRFFRSAGWSSSPKSPRDRGRARLRPIHGSDDAIVSGA